MHGHSYEDADDGFVYTFNYHGDYSGDVIVTKHSEPHRLQDIIWEVRIPAVAIVDLVGRMYNSALISKVEDMTGAETLDFLLGRL